MSGQASEKVAIMGRFLESGNGLEMSFLFKYQMLVQRGERAGESVLALTGLRQRPLVEMMVVRDGQRADPSTKWFLCLLYYGIGMGTSAAMGDFLSGWSTMKLSLQSFCSATIISDDDMAH